MGEEVHERILACLEAILEEIRGLREDGEKGRKNGLHDAMKVVEGTGIGEILKNISKGR